jgi:hypothetical protein
VKPFVLAIATTPRRKRRDITMIFYHFILHIVNWSVVEGGAWMPARAGLTA